MAKIDEVRAEQARSTENLAAVGTNLAQTGTDLTELLDRIATAAEAGDPTDADIAAARAIADGLGTTAADLLTTSARIDAILAAPVAPPEPPVEPPVEPTS